MSRQKSSRSTSQSNGSKKRWRQPKTIMQFASQVNDVCNRVLNDEIDIEKAKLFSAMARVVTQAANVEVSKARLAKEVPDLALDQMDDDDDDE